MVKFASSKSNGRSGTSLSGLVQDKNVSKSMRSGKQSRKKGIITAKCLLRTLFGCAIVITIISYAQLSRSLQQPRSNVIINRNENDRSLNKPESPSESTGKTDLELPSSAHVQTKFNLKNNGIDEILQKQKAPVKPSTSNAKSSQAKSENTIAYAVSITSCVLNERNRLIDGAAVLKHSIHLNSIDNHKNNNNGSKFSYEMFAFVHPDANDCTPHLQQLGYTVMIKETPVDPTQIKGAFYKEHVVKSGCCGDREFLKLYAYTLFDYPIVVHLDIDSLILKPLDDLFLVMLNSDGSKDQTKINDYGGANLKNVPVMYEKPIPQIVDAFFTRDYNMVRPGKKYPGFQGGFLIVRPSQKAFDQYIDIILEGDFHKGSGWAGLGFGGYYGAQQIQGIASYYYDHFHPNTAIELNRCVYNSMADDPRSPIKDGARCRDGRDLCEDCRGKPIEDVRSIHFTLCQKPWLCNYFPESGPTISTNKMCNKFHREWHRVRADLEEFLEAKKETHSATWKSELYYGHCNHAGAKGYIPLFEGTSTNIKK